MGLWALTMLAAALSADTGLITDAAQALSNRDVNTFLAAFDPSTPGLDRLRGYLSTPATDVEIPSVEFLGYREEKNGEGTVEMNWSIRIVQRSGPPATTERHSRVTCRLALRNGTWRIVSLEPLDAFAPPDVGGAWDALRSAISAWLPEQQLDDPAALFPSFDVSMPGLDRLRVNVAALLAMGDLHTSIDLIGNEGDDTYRKIEGTWTLEIADANTGIQIFQRTGRVVCQVARRRKEWKIVGLKPLTFFDPPAAGKIGR